MTVNISGPLTLINDTRPVPGGAVGPNPTDQAKAGSKRSVLVAGSGGPLSVVERPGGIAEGIQNLCSDKGYDNPTVHRAVSAHGYRRHIRRIGEEKLDAEGVKRYPARRWVGERALAWLSKCRAILVRYGKKESNYIGLIQVSCALLWYHRQWRLKF